MNRISRTARLEVKDMAFLIPLICLILAYFASAFFYSEFIESDPAKEYLPTGLKPADVMLVPIKDLSISELAALNNKAYAARSSWTAFAYLHVTVCIVAMMVGVLLIFAAAKKPRWIALVVSIACFLYMFSQIANFTLIGNYKVFAQLIQQTIATSQLSGFPKVLIYAIFLNKISFYAAAILAVAGGMTLFELRSNNNELKAKHLREEIKLQQIALYMGTIVLISAILLWSFTLRWALVYVYPWDGLVYQSIESLINGQITTVGIYYSILLAVAYIPVAAIHHRRALKLAEQEIPKESADQQSTWLKINDTLLIAAPPVLPPCRERCCTGRL